MSDLTDALLNLPQGPSPSYSMSDLWGKRKLSPEMAALPDANAPIDYSRTYDEKTANADLKRRNDAIDAAKEFLDKPDVFSNMGALRQHQIGVPETATSLHDASDYWGGVSQSLMRDQMLRAKGMGESSLDVAKGLWGGGSRTIHDVINPADAYRDIKGLTSGVSNAVMHPADTLSNALSAATDPETQGRLFGNAVIGAVAPAAVSGAIRVAPKVASAIGSKIPFVGKASKLARIIDALTPKAASVAEAEGAVGLGGFAGQPNKPWRANAPTTLRQPSGWQEPHPVSPFMGQSPTTINVNAFRSGDPAVAARFGGLTNPEAVAENMNANAAYGEGHIIPGPMASEYPQAPVIQTYDQTAEGLHPTVHVPSDFTFEAGNPDIPGITINGQQFPTPPPSIPPSILNLKNSGAFRNLPSNADVAQEIRSRVRNRSPRR